MSRYIVTNDSFFTPYTYDELLKPLQQMTDAHNAAADAYDALSMETAALGQYISKNKGDERARAMYDNYINQLSSLQESLWEKGYNHATRGDLSSARYGYANNIKPIQEAISNRQKRSEEFWKAIHNNPTLIYGNDPMTQGLDNYLDDPNYGLNWFSYSGEQFMNEVGADAKARASEMLRNPEIARDPRLVGYLTRIEKEGFTSQEVQNASNLVYEILDKKIDRNSISSNSTPESILANILLSHLDSTGAYGNVDPSQFSRLVRYGVAGLAQGIGKTSVNYLNDKVWDEDMKLRNIAYQHSLSSGKNSGSKKGSNDEDITYGPDRQRNWHEEVLNGENSRRMQRRLNRFLGDPSAPGKMLVTKNGQNEVHNNVDASMLVYGADIRDKYKQSTGLDVGLEPSMARTPSEYISGKVNIDGDIYNVRVTPSGIVQWMDENGRPHNSKKLTQQYAEGRKEFLDNVEYYQKNEKDIFKMATITPERQRDFYEKNGVDTRVPLNELREFVQSDQSNAMGYSRSYVDISSPGLDMGKYNEKLTSMLAASLKAKNDNTLAKDRVGARSTKGNYFHGIHKINQNTNMPEYDAIKKLDDYFDYKDGKITNVTHVNISEDAIVDGYLIYNLTNGDKVAVGIDKLDSQPIKGIYELAKTALRDIYLDNYTDDEDKKEDILGVLQWATGEIQNQLGKVLSSESSSGTLGEKEEIDPYYMYRDW